MKKQQDKAEEATAQQTPQATNEEAANKFETLFDALVYIQHRLVAPKGNWNEFNSFSYRNAEGILEALKPLLWETRCVLVISHDVIERRAKTYIKATATILKGSESISSDGYAWESDAQRKGMDTAQMTGACTSYAKKYALCSLFAIDDSKDDPDTKDNRNIETEQVQPASTPLTDDQRERIANAPTIDELKKVCGVISRDEGADKNVVLTAYNARAAELRKGAQQ